MYCLSTSKWAHAIKYAKFLNKIAITVFRKTSKQTNKQTVHGAGKEGNRDMKYSRQRGSFVCPALYPVS